MALLRQQAVAKAKKMGICTQCLKLKAIKSRMQCQRCIDTNRRKWKTSTNPFRQKIMDYAEEHNICTRCFCRDTTGSEIRQCVTCRKIKPIGRPKGSTLTDKQRRDRKAGYQKKYKLNALTNKVRKLDRIRRAVKKGVEL